MSKWTKELKKYEKYMTDYYKKKKVKKDKQYSSFWWDDDWANGNNRFSGLNDDVKTTSSSDIVKMIKLTSYQRAIANFVKIVTKKDIPVVFGGNTSMTNGKQVILASDLSDKNFDVAVGLALHEASHIKLTNFQDMLDYIKNAVRYDDASNFKSLFNIIEDRRIDNYIFKTSPGYRAYYHKMYDHYFHSDDINKALVSKSFRDATNIAHYMFRIANMTNPLSDKKALPGLEEIIKLIHVPSIGRLESTTDSLVLAHDVMSIIKKHVKEAQENQQSQGTAQSNDQQSKQDGGDSDSDENTVEANDSNNDEMGNLDIEMDLDNMEGENSSSDTDSDNTIEVPELTASEMMRVQKAWDKQKEFIDGDIKKKTTTKKLQDQIEQISKMDLDLQMVGDENTGYQCIIYNLSNKVYFRNVLALCYKYNKADHAKNNDERRAVVEELSKLTGVTLHGSHRYYNIQHTVDLPSFLRNYPDGTYIQKGLELGALLGRKLQVRNEERSLVYNRLTSGNIDSKRLSHAGYGIETVFKQIHIDKYKQACLHISIDMSGSMGGTKWNETVQMTTAIVKAATYVQNLRIQVSARTTESSGRKELPVLALVYDSKYNDVKHYTDVMQAMRPTNCTPEGLCFDALMRKNLLIPSTSECTSYFLNISDGAPGMSGFGGHEAINYTRKQVQKMRNDYGVNVLSFYVDDSRSSKDSNEPNAWFKEMYGRDARKVAADNVTQIARELNAKFLSEGKYTI